MGDAKRWVQVPVNATGYRAKRWTNTIMNMPEENISDFDSFHMYIIDDLDRENGTQGDGTPGMVQHEALCNAVYDLFKNVFTDCTVHSVRMKTGQKEADFVQYFATELEQYNSHDLVGLYYHGKAGIDEGRYTWRFRGPGTRSIDAHDFILQVNRSRADCYFILDCFVPTHFPKEWMRKSSMTEFSLTGHQMRNDHGQPVNGPENFTETLCRAVHDMADRPRGDTRQTIHEIIAKDKTKCSRPLRLWTARPRRNKRADVWRFFVDIQRCIQNGRFEMRKCKITGRREGDGRFDNDEIEDNEENVVDPDEGEDDNARLEVGRRRRDGRGDDDDDDSSSDSDSALGHGIDGGANGVLDDEHDSDNGDAGGMRRLAGGGNHLGDIRPRLYRQPSERPRSPTPSSARKSIKRSRSPSFDLEGLGRLGREISVKREPSESPEIEIMSSRTIKTYVDLTTIDDVIDLTQEDGPEETLFIS